MRAARVAFRLVCFSVLVLAIVEVAWMRPARSAEEKDPEKQESSAAAKPEAGESAKAEAKDEPKAEPKVASVTAESISQELENKRLAVEEREKEVGAYEARLKEREKEIEKKIKEMERLRDAVSGELEAQRKSNEERVVKMVAVFETMTPKSASAVFETLDDWLAVEVLKRMDVKRVAKIMNLMDKNRSAKLSELLTGYYHPEAKVSAAKPAGQAPAQTVAKATAQPAAPETPGRAPASPKNPPQDNQKKGGEK